MSMTDNQTLASETVTTYSNGDTVTSEYKEVQSVIECAELNGVELLHEGEFTPSNWGSRPWSVNAATIDEIQRNTERYMAESGEVPYMKAGVHDDKVSEDVRSLLKAVSLGNVSRVYSEIREKGKTLLADFIGIPEAMLRLIRDGHMSKRSVEIRTRPSYGPMLDAVAFFGAGTPAVKGLNDLADSITANESTRPSDGEIAVLCLDFEQSDSVVENEIEEEQTMDQIEEMQAKIAALTLENEQLKADAAVKLSEADSKLETLTTELTVKDAMLAEYQAKESEMVKASRVAYVDTLIAAGKLAPAVKDATVMLCAESDAETFNKVRTVLDALPVDRRFEEQIPAADVVKFAEGDSNEQKIAKWCKANDMDPNTTEGYKAAWAALKLGD